MELLREVYVVYKSDPLIDELGFVPVPDNFTDHPPVLLVQHKLGLALNQIYPLYCAARAAFMQRDASLEVMAATVLLFINADCYSAWNVRRKLCSDGCLDINSEMRFVDVILTKHRKSSCAWWHRQWVCTNLIRNFGDGVQYSKPVVYGKDALIELLTRELDVCEMGADRYRRCYYAWQYRVWLCKQLNHSLLTSTDTLGLLHNEVLGVRKWITSHVTDASAFSYLQQLIIQQMAVKASAHNSSSDSTYKDLALDLKQRQQQQLQADDNALRLEPGDGANENIFEHDSAPLLLLLKSHCVFAMVIASTYPGHHAVWQYIRFLAQQLWIIAMPTTTTTTTMTIRNVSVERARTAGIVTVEYCESELKADGFEQRCIARLNGALDSAWTGQTFDVETTVLDPNRHDDTLALVDHLIACLCVSDQQHQIDEYDNDISLAEEQQNIGEFRGEDVGSVDGEDTVILVLEWLVSFIHATVADDSCAAADQQRENACAALKWIGMSCSKQWNK